MVPKYEVGSPASYNPIFPRKTKCAKANELSKFSRGGGVSQ